MKNSTPFISVVVPCYNEADNIPLIVEQLHKALHFYRFEIVFVDDGSTDNSAQVYVPLAEVNANVNYLCFTRNFGHQAALLAGIHHAKGDVIVTIDADLQQPPAIIPRMIEKWQAGSKVVEAIPEYIDSIGWFKKNSSHLFYWFLNKLSDTPITKSANDFRLIDRSVANLLKQLKEKHLYLRGIYSWMGYSKAFVTYRHLKRINGETHYPLPRMLRLAFTGITTMSIRPLRLSLFLGSVVSLISFGIILWALYLAVFTSRTVPGWTSSIISTVFLAGIQLLVLGIIGEYIGKLFMENKQRPSYIIEKTNYLNENIPQVDIPKLTKEAY